MQSLKILLHPHAWYYLCVYIRYGTVHILTSGCLLSWAELSWAEKTVFVKEDCLRGGLRRSFNLISPLNMESHKKPMLLSKKWKMTGWEFSTPNVFVISTMNSSAVFCLSTNPAKQELEKLTTYTYQLMTQQWLFFSVADPKQKFWIRFWIRIRHAVIFSP